MYLYLKAIHIVFVVTWFAGLFYFPRLLIYNIEAGDKEPAARDILRAQFNTMMKRLWYGITWPSAILTLILGMSVMLKNHWEQVFFSEAGRWLLVKLIFVVLLYVYHFSLHYLFRQQQRGIFKYSSQQMRMWNEVATIFLAAIVLLATVKTSISWVYGVLSIVALIFVLMLAINIYKKLRKGN
jgi:putative membrane protein